MNAVRDGWSLVLRAVENKGRIRRTCPGRSVGGGSRERFPFLVPERGQVIRNLECAGRELCGTSVTSSE